MLEWVIAGFHFRRDVEDRLLDSVEVRTGQFDRGALIAGFDVLEQTQVFIVAAGLMTVIIERGGIQRGPRDQLLEPVEQYRIVQAARQFEVELAE